MKPEDLGIAPFTLEPDSPPHLQPSGPGTTTEQLVQNAEDVQVNVRNLAVAAAAIGKENASLRSAYERARAGLNLAAAEAHHLRSALEEARRHRAILFWIGIVLLGTLVLRAR